MATIEVFVIGSRDEKTWLDADPSEGVHRPLDTMTTKLLNATRFPSYAHAYSKLHKMRAANASCATPGAVILVSFLDNAEVFRVECTTFRTA